MATPSPKCTCQAKGPSPNEGSQRHVVCGFEILFLRRELPAGRRESCTGAKCKNQEHVQRSVKSLAGETTFTIGMDFRTRQTTCPVIEMPEPLAFRAGKEPVCNGRDVPVKHLADLGPLLPCEFHVAAVKQVIFQG